MSNTLYAQVAAISMRGKGLPANDLLYNGNTLNPEAPLPSNIDLSKLNPKETDIWSAKQKSLISPDFTINNKDRVKFQGIIKTQDGAGEFIFKVVAGDSSIHTLLFDKKMHSTFLRNNLLKKLGYIIPGMKYLKNVTVSFQSLNQKKAFLKKMTRSVLGKPDHWIIENKKKELSITFHDVAVIGLGDQQLYDLAAGVPVQAPYKNLRSRVIRATLLPYSLVDLKESVNKFPWNLGRIEQGKLLLPHFFSSHSFAPTTIDDIKWIARKIEKLSREDFEEVVRQAHFPYSVEKVIIEKIISRRNSVLKTIGIKHDEIAFDSQVTNPPRLVNGKVIKKDWKDFGYASKFATGDATSPFKDFHYYLLSILQTAALNNLVALANNQLRAFDPNNARLDLAKKEFEKGLDHFVKTGEFLQFPVSSWTTPILGGGLIASRDVVVGNYLGTENLVQLADTFGYTVRTGLMTGLENIDALDQVLFNARLTYVKTFTHLKPLVSVKDVFKEKYKNIIVPLIKKDLQKYLNRALPGGDAPLGSEIEGEDPDAERLKEIMKEIAKVLGIGESLIITERLSPSIGAAATIPLMNTGASFRLAISGNQIGLKRMHFLRKDAKTIQIFDDRGKALGYNFSIDLKYQIPLIRFNREVKKGNYKVDNYNLNIEADIKKNPKFYHNVRLLNDALTTSSTELLQTEQTPNHVESDFTDKYTGMSLLFLKRRRLRGYTDYKVKALKKLKGNYISYRDTVSVGLNWESFAKEVIMRLMRNISEQAVWANDIWGNPGDTLLGSSKMDEMNYEARVKENGTLDLEYISLGYKYTGWSKKAEKIKKIADKLNKKFNKPLFAGDKFIDLKKMSLYDIKADVRIYAGGIKRLKTMTQDYLIKRAAINEHLKINSCASHLSFRTLESGVKIATCGHLSRAIRLNSRCQKLELEQDSLKKRTKCWLKLAYQLFKDLDYDQFSSILGKQNLYLSGSINGFRKDSELLREPILSNTYGRKNTRYPNGPLRQIERKLGIGQGEFEGYWMRDRL